MKLVLSTCAKIAPVEHPHTAETHLGHAMGSPPLSSTVIGRWTLFGWAAANSTNSVALAAIRQAPLHALDHVALFVNHQRAGRGQQQRIWTQEPERDLAMTAVVSKSLPEKHPFVLNLAVSLAVIEAIEEALPTVNRSGLEIKWPNDIMWRGRKAGGILIENNWRGNAWSSAVIGIGLNIAGQPPFPNAARLLPETQTDPAPLLDELRKSILLRIDQRMAEMVHPEALLRQYHQRLHGWGQAQRWQLDGEPISGTLESIDIEGRLCISTEGVQHCFSPGEVGWLGMEPRK